MDRAGLLANIANSAAAIYQGRKWQNTDGFEHEGRVTYHDGLSIALDAFKEIQTAASDDLELLMVAEYTFLGQEFHFCDPSDIKTRNSLAAALQSFDEALLALKEVEAATYGIVDRCFAHRKECRYNGMPKDAFHYACSGHKARFDNSLRSPSVVDNEKVLLEQRYANIVTAQSVYLKKQKKALGEK